MVDDTVVWTRGFGVANADTGAPVTPDTLFQIGSVTKSFTAAARLTAASQGAITLDKPVATYVSGVTTCVGAPTLAQLLSHTGGLIDEPNEFGPLARGRTTSNLPAWFLRSPTASGQPVTA